MSHSLSPSARFHLIAGERFHGREGRETCVREEEKKERARGKRKDEVGKGEYYRRKSSSIFFFRATSF